MRMSSLLLAVSMSWIACRCALPPPDSVSGGGAAAGGGPSSGGGSSVGGGAASGGGSATGGGTASADAGVACSYTYSGFNASTSVNATSTVSWACTATTRSVASNGLPDHAVGTFPNPDCPNTIKASSVSASMPLSPVNTGTAARIAVLGYHLNGVKFDPGTAGSCDNAGTSCSLIGNSGSWNIEALGQSSFNFGVDSSNAHVQPTGEYHYHGMPEGSLGAGATMKLVGFALDGFPIYARYGHDVATDGISAVRVLKASYQLKATADANRPSTTTYPLGAFTQDYEYVAGSGDLDECNGRTGVTPEFPGGTYHYTITDTYPFIQRCVKGTATGGGMMGAMGDGGMMAPGACAPGQTSMCCGDGVCDGPETTATCAADCP
jgi:hypothetical protein